MLSALTGSTLLVIGAALLLLFLLPRLDQAFQTRTSHTKEVPMPTSLHPVVDDKKEELIQKTADKGITIVITDGFRSEEEQDRLYEQGRSKEGDVVTNVKGGGSYHNYGLAIDFALKKKNGEVIWDMKRDGNKNGKSDWMEVVDTAKSLGFDWGGDWASFKDYPHLQMDFDLSIRELKRGERPQVKALAEEK
ncbi:M15 family metallopeptidase [Halobacillus salinarum]|uniref:M15 family metallopeptidase n=1 Tax=Halobacillus salinarum TaxID=2932257 RepID=A0ABY4ES33_9BACI|nr:M15 family metallopeptidase [Halobacillus salinarum]UOQ46532.1 M15 family metallopeptidase [Halobacillus salinarum]